MANTPLARTVDAHLKHTGSDLETFLRKAVDLGASPEVTANEITRLTEVQVSPRTVYRWIDELGIKRPDLRKVVASL